MTEFLLSYLFICLAIWFTGWLIVDHNGITNPMFGFILKWYDGWVGFFWDSKKKWLYVFPLPFFGIIIKPFRNNYN